LVHRKIIDIPTSVIGVIIFFYAAFEYGDGGIFKLLSWMQNLRHSTWDHEILCADRSSKDEQLNQEIQTLWAAES
jgi:hypothetical protein